MRVLAHPSIALIIALFVAVGVSACSSSSSSSSSKPPPPKAGDPMPWPAPPDPMGLARRAGLVAEDAERLEFHVHAHLDVFINGQHIVVPGGIGIETTDPQVHSATIGGYPAYGGITTPCAKPCISSLHTHDATGVLHTESATQKENTLGQFFIEWNVKLDANCVGSYCKPATPVDIYVNGKKFTGDPTGIPLSDHKEIAVVIGTPPAEIPSAY
jgi:hypothetical protein